MSDPANPLKSTDKKKKNVEKTGSNSKLPGLLDLVAQATATQATIDLM